MLTAEPHIAGREQDEEVLTEFIENKWKEAGLDVVIHPYKVLLSYPNDEDPNYVAIKTENEEEVYKSHSVEKILDPSQDKPGVVNPFNAYSPYGNATVRISEFYS